MMSIYVLDTNFFIQAHRFYYPLDVFVSFWNQVKNLAEQGSIISIDKVKDELYKNDDELKAWCEGNLPSIFFKDTSTSIGHYSRIVNWADSRNHYSPKALTEFMGHDEADAWLAAYCLSNTNDHHLVTLETSEPNRKSKVKLPDVCIANGINHLNNIEMFRQLGVQL